MDNSLMLQDLYDGVLKDINHKEYKTEHIDGIVDKGKLRDYQQDSILMMEREDASIMAVADGLGGSFGPSELASNYICLLFALWFKEMNFSSYDLNAVDRKIKELILSASKEILNRRYGETTLTLALRLQNETLAYNIGDSRMYKLVRVLTQIFEDQSEAWEEYKKWDGIIQNKDDIRFFKRNNYILSCVGDYYESPKIDSKVIPNNYNYLLLCSDGITDLVKDNDLFAILKDGENKKAERIINKALTEDISQTGLDIDDDEFFFWNNISAGKDNASIVLYKAMK